MRYWITHPNLTPAHDQEVDALSLTDWQRSGWRIREDQSAPPPDLTPADPRPPVDDDDAVDTPPTLPATGGKAATSRRKGEV